MALAYMRAAADQLGGRDAGDLFDVFRGVFGHRLFQGLEVFGALGDVRLVVELFTDDDLHHAVDQGDIGARDLPEPEAGILHQAMAPGVDDDEVFIFETRRPLDAGRNDRVVFVGVGADHQDAIGVFQFGDGIGHRPGTERRGQTGHGGAVSEAGAVIHVVGADRRRAAVFCIR